MIKIGLTGNIASGKSEVEKIIEKLGFIVIDLDKATHEFYENNTEVKKEILNLFHTLNRKEISKIVFSDLKKKKELEDIIFPKLKDFIKNVFDKNKDEKFIVISGALLFESGFNKLFDKIIFVDSKKEIRLERLMKRNNLSKNEAFIRIDSQKQINKNEVDYIIENNLSIIDLEKEVKSIITIFEGSAK